MPVDLPSTLEADVLVSMDGSGLFTGVNDRLTPYTHAERGVEIDEGRDGAQQLSPPKVAAGGFDLKNDRGAFSPDNPTSPVYQRFIPGRPVAFRAYHGVRRAYRSHTGYREHVPYRGKALYPLGRHIIDDLPESTEIGSRRVSVETLGYETLLTGAPVTIPLMVQPLVSDCFTAYLDAVAWPSDKRDIATSSARLLYYWADERVPWDGMLELLASEGPGAFGVRGDGTFYFEGRNYRTTTARSVTSQATFYDRKSGGRRRYRAHTRYRDHRLYRGHRDLTYSSLQSRNPFKAIRNRATYTTRRRAVAPSLQQIYDYGATLSLSANQVRVLFIRPTDPFIEAVSPVAGVDYTVSVGAATVSLTYQAGFLAIVTVTAGPSGATITGVTSTGLQLRAKPLTVLSEATVENTVDASNSIAVFSPIPGQNIPITLPVQGWPEIDPAEAEAVCDAWVLRYQTLRPSATFTLQNGDAESLEQILRRRISDRITLVHPVTGLAADVWINGRTLRISGAAGRTVELTLLVERCDAISGAIWDVSPWDVGLWGV